MKRKLLFLLMVGLLGVGQLRAQPADTLLHLPQLIDELLQNNPELQGAYSAWQADQARVPQAGALPDPLFSFNLLNLPVNSFAFDQEPMTGKQFMLVQTLPFPGKLGLKEKIAREKAAVTEAQYQELRNRLVKELQVTYYEIFYLDKAIEVVQRNTNLMEQFVEIAETKYAVGKGLQQDVLRAQVELSRMHDRFINLQQKRAVLEARFNALLNRPADRPVGKIAELTLADFPYDFKQLQELARENRPLLKAWQAMIRQSEKKIDLAKKQYWPDFRLGVAYTQRDVLANGMGGVDFFSGLVTVNVPLYFWKKQKRNVEESRYSNKMLQQRYLNVENQVFAAIDQKLAELQKNRRLAELYRNGIIPQATQSLNSTLSGYRTDKVDFLTLLNSQITLFNYERDYYRILSDYNKNIAELNLLVGLNLFQN